MPQQPQINWDELPDKVDLTGLPDDDQQSSIGKTVKDLSSKAKQFLADHPIIGRALSGEKEIELHGNKYPVVTGMGGGFLPELEHPEGEGWPGYLARGAYNTLIQPLSSPGGMLGAMSLPHGKLPEMPVVKPRLELPSGQYEMPPINIDTLRQFNKGKPTFPAELPTKYFPGREPTIEEALMNSERAAVFNKPKSVIDVKPTKIEEAIPEDVFRKAQQIGKSQKFNEVINVAKEIKSSFDLPPLFRQGAGLLYRKESWKSTPAALRAMFDEEFYQTSKKEIVGRIKPWMAKGKLAITDPDGPIGNREESFLTNIGEKIPFGIGKGIRASNRGYNTMLNTMRISTAESMEKDLARMGRDIHSDAKLAKEVSEFINVATGRGSLNLGKVISGGYIEPASMGNLEKVAVELNAGIFSPRLTSAQFTVLNPLYYTKADPFVRREALKSLLGRIGLGITVLGVAKATGARVNTTEPTNADFMKAVINNTRLDPWAGEQQLAVLASRLAPTVGPFGNSISSTSGKTTEFGVGYRADDRLDVAGRYAKNKEAPILALVHHLITQKGSDGKPIQLTKEIKDLVAPMYLADLVQLIKEDPSILPWAAPSSFGVGMQTYEK